MSFLPSEPIPLLKSDVFTLPADQELLAGAEPSPNSETGDVDMPGQAHDVRPIYFNVFPRLFIRIDATGHVRMATPLESAALGALRKVDDDAANADDGAKDLHRDWVRQHLIPIVYGDLSRDLPNMPRGGSAARTAATLNNWLQTATTEAPGGTADAAELYAAYFKWMFEKGVTPLDRRPFDDAISNQGFYKKPKRQGRVRWHGLALVSPSEGAAR